MPFLRRSPRPLSASSLRFKPRMPFQRSGTDRCRATPASGIFLSHLQRAGRRGLLASQLHELHPVFSDASLQFVLQGFGQVNVPEVRPEAGFRHVLLCEHGFLWSGSSRESYDRVSSGLRPKAPFFGCWLGKSDLRGFVRLFDKTAAGPKSFFSLYAGFGVSIGGIIPYRGFQLGAFDTIVRLNPWKNDTGIITRLHVCGSTDSQCVSRCRQKASCSTHLQGHC